MSDDLVQQLAVIASESRAYGYGEFADVAVSARNEIERLRAEVDLLRSAGVCELAAHNPAVAEYARHWERRAEQAESERDALRERIASAVVSVASDKAESIIDRLREVGYYDGKRVALVVLAD